MDRVYTACKHKEINLSPLPNVYNFTCTIDRRTSEMSRSRGIAIHSTKSIQNKIQRHRPFPPRPSLDIHILTIYASSNTTPTTVRTALSTPNLRTSESNTPSNPSHTPRSSTSRPTNQSLSPPHKTGDGKYSSTALYSR